MSRDWIEWHAGYERKPEMQTRLAMVQAHVADALSRADRNASIRVISMCAGDGRDLLEVLAHHAAATRVEALLVELDRQLAHRAREAARRVNATRIEVIAGDAGWSTPYREFVPADLILACGVFGNISDGDIRRTIGALPTLSAAGARVIWTRHNRPPDRTPAIRAWFRAAGFSELAFDAIGRPGPTVGVAQLETDPMPYRSGIKLFQFVD